MASHFLSQPPQSAALLKVSTQVPAEAQYSCPLAGHLHAPEAQISPGLQVLPHAPQFCVSLKVSKHAFCAAQNC